MVRESGLPRADSQQRQTAQLLREPSGRFDNKQTDWYVCWMSEAHRSQKQPEQVRILLIESARHLALENGLAAVSVEAVAAHAGVTKGGLFHHFPSKQALVDAVFRHLLEEFEADLDARMAADPESYGRFTRAFIRSVFDVGANGQWSPLWIATVTDRELRRLWGEWLSVQLSRHGENALGLESARFAADGVWLGQMFGVAPADPDAFQRHLIEMTRNKA